MTERSRHWESVHTERAPEDVSWYRAEPATSSRLIRAAATGPGGVLDVGAGTGTLVDDLLQEGRRDLTVLDVSGRALQIVRERLGAAAGEVGFVVADLATWRPERQWRVWHDRAVLHFLVDPVERAHYVEIATAAVLPGGALVIGCFGSDGPEQCSGLPTARYGPQQLAELFSRGFTLEHTEQEQHTTPWGGSQSFTWAILRRRDA